MLHKSSRALPSVIAQHPQVSKTANRLGWDYNLDVSVTIQTPSSVNGCAKHSDCINKVWWQALTWQCWCHSGLYKCAVVHHSIQQSTSVIVLLYHDWQSYRCFSHKEQVLSIFNCMITGFHAVALMTHWWWTAFKGTILQMELCVRSSQCRSGDHTPHLAGHMTD